MPYETILVERKDTGVGLVTLNRPEVLNALSGQLMSELGTLLTELDDEKEIGAIVLTGNAKAFAAGADIRQMQSRSFADVYGGDFITRNWEGVTLIRKPVLAAVAGYALGGGCELAMMCDFILAADTAKFGQPEIKLGVIPGAGGSQRLTRSVGKSKSMEMCLTGRMMNAEEAERAGLVSRIVPADELLEEALRTAAAIAAMPRLAAMAAKEAVNAAHEMTLTQGVRFERRLFHALFATEDQKEGMAAFVEKREAHFKGR